MTLILVVEDSPTQAAELQLLLEGAGFQVELARDGNAGLERCQALGVDAVLSDVIMPDMDGYELCRRVKRDPKTVQIPVILLTSLSDPMDIIRGLECGADNFLTKPYDGAHLIGRVRRLLENRALGGDRRALLGKPFIVNSEKEQLLDLPLSTFEEVLRSRQRELEAKLSEQLQRDSLRFLQSALDALTKRIAIVDEAGAVVAVNASFRQFALENGWVHAETLEGANYFESWSQSLGALDHRAKVLGGLRSVQAGEQGSFALEYSVRVGSSNRVLSLSIARFSDRGRSLLAIEHEDITSRKQLERQFHHAQKMEAVAQLASGVAHDFNNLLTVIRSYGDLLMQEFPAGDQRHADLEQILHATDAAGALTKQLLAFGRQQLLKLEVLDINGVISDLDKMLRRLIGEDIEYATALEPSIARVEADPGQIQQIMMNLVINARDAMPKGGKLSVETKTVLIDEPHSASHHGIARGQYLVIEVTDTGSGMSADVQARIFEPFFTTKEVGRGTGLGLSTVYGIVQQCRGQIWVHSEIDRGTTFQIYLPCVDAPLTVKASSFPAVIPGSETILVVEDNAAVRSVLCRVLKDAGYAVLAAGDAAEARTLCTSYRESIQLLLTDVVMPGLSGPDLATELAQQRTDMKILFMSGYSGTAITRHDLLEDGSVFLQKPFSPSSVTRAVRAALGG